MQEFTEEFKNMIVESISRESDKIAVCAKYDITLHELNKWMGSVEQQCTSRIETYSSVESEDEVESIRPALFIGEYPESFKRRVLSEYCGYNIIDLSAKYGVSDSTLRKWIKRAGMEASKEAAYDSHFKAEVLTSIKVGNSIDVVCNKFGVSAPTVYVWCTKHHIKHVREKGIEKGEASDVDVLAMELALLCD